MEYIANKSIQPVRVHKKSIPYSLKHLRAKAYTTIVGSVLEYASSIWDGSLTQSQSTKLEAVQRKAVRDCLDIAAPTWSNWTQGRRTNFLIVPKHAWVLSASTLQAMISHYWKMPIIAIIIFIDWTNRYLQIFSIFLVFWNSTLQVIGLTDTN